MFNPSIKCLKESNLAKNLANIQMLLTPKPTLVRPFRAVQYVPTTSSKFLEKSLNSDADVVVYDLEDSVPKAHKNQSRDDFQHFISTKDLRSKPRRALRPNDVTTEWFEDDIRAFMSLLPPEPLWDGRMESKTRGEEMPLLLVPKVESPGVLSQVAEVVRASRPGNGHMHRVPIIASIESPQALWNIGEIANFRGQGVRVVGITFAAEDFCASSHIIRSPSRLELLYARSKIVHAATTFGIQAIDMVCTRFKGQDGIDVLTQECHEARGLGFTGKQSIHPAQNSIIQSSFSPSPNDIQRASMILKGMKHSEDLDKKGAFGLDMGNGKTEMIDEPMVKQAKFTIEMARLLGLVVPKLD